MLIDADVHISPTPEGGNSIGIDELLRRMDRSGVDKALTWLQPPYLREIDEANRYIFDSTRRHPNRILGFGWVDPRLGLHKAQAMVKVCVSDYNFPGVKLNGAQNSYYIDDPHLSLPVIETIAETGRVLALHVGTDAYEQTHPFRVSKIAQRFPELTILMVHMGGVGFADISNAAIEVAQSHPNLYLIGSAVRSMPILKAIHTLGPHRVCFGSDTPFELMHVEIAKYNALLDGEITPDQKALVMGGNILRLFNL